MSVEREEYEVEGLREADASPDPFAQFDDWFEAAVAAGLPQPNTMMLATSSTEGEPSLRAVLLKGASSDGFDFYTSYESRKGRELSTNPHAAACFVWQPLHRQVRVEGTVAKLSAEASDAYFETRPRGAQLAAAASDQSSAVADRTVLTHRYQELEAAFEGRAVPRPPGWGGYRLVPNMFEFWQGQPNRFHDRLQYRRSASGWEIVRLAP